MKVAIFTTNNLLEPNAASLLVNEPLKQLVNVKDLEIHLIAPSDIPKELKKDIKLIRYTQYNKPVLSFLSAFLAIPKLLREDYDLYHSIGLKATSILVIAQKLKRKKPPILHFGLEITTELKLSSIKSLKKRILYHLFKAREKKALKYSHAIIVPTNAYRDYMIKHNLYKGRIFVAPFALDLGLFGKEYKRNLALISELGVKNKKVIMYTGEVTPLHGVLDLVKAMEIINSEIRDVVLIIVGDGSALHEIKKYVGENKLDTILFIGRIPHEKIPEYHSIADVLIIPHIRRIDSELVYPSKLLECLASGKPIVASNLKAIADVVGDNAFLVEPESPRAFAEGILTLIHNEELMKKIGENGKKIIYNYSWEEAAKRIYEAYEYLAPLT